MSRRVISKLTLALPTIAAVLWLAVFPLLNGGSYSGFTLWKLQAMQLLILITIPLTVVPALLQHRFKPRPFHAVLFLWMVWIVLSCLFSPGASLINTEEKPTVWFGALRYEGGITLLGYGLIAFLLSLNPIHRKTLVYAVALSLTIHAVIIGLQYTGINVFGLYPSGRSVITNYEFQGTLGNIDFLSGLLCLQVPLLAIHYLQGGSAILLLPILTGGLLMNCINVESGLLTLFGGLISLLVMIIAPRPKLRSRGFALFAVLLGSIAMRFLLLLPWKNAAFGLTVQPSFFPLFGCTLAAVGLSVLLHFHPGKALPAWLAPVILLAVFLYTLILLALIPVAKDAGSIWQLHELLNGRMQDSFGSQRVGIWHAACLLTGENPLFGLGADTLWATLPTELPRLGIRLVQAFDNPHNLFLQIAVSCGIPALLLWGIAVILSIKSGWHSMFAAAIACFLVQGIFTFSICIISPVFYAVIGLAISEGGCRHERTAASTSEKRLT